MTELEHELLLTVAFALARVLDQLDRRPSEMASELRLMVEQVKREARGQESELYGNA